MLMGPDGKPIKTVKEPVEGHDLVECNVLVNDVVRMEAAAAISMPTPRGIVPVHPQQVLSSIAFNIYNLMQATGMREMIFTVTDKSSELCTEKQMKIAMMEIPKPKVEGEEQTENETEDGKQE